MHEETLTDPLQARVEAAMDLASSITDDEQVRLQIFTTLINLADRASIALDEGNELIDLSSLAEAIPADRLRGDAGSPQLPPEDSIFRDPLYIANAPAVLMDSTRIVGGKLTKLYPDCVAIGSVDSWCCTGTLVASNVVVTAGHCARGDCAARVFIGTDVNDPSSGREIAVQDAIVHDRYDAENPHYDLAALVLAEDVTDVTPRAIASQQVVESSRTIRLVGFGNTDIHSMGGYGEKRVVDVPMASANTAFGAEASIEFVAGAPFLDRDSCNGDSGGPAYAYDRSTEKWFVAGATSRATASSIRPCGDGGVYTRIHAFQDWLKGIPGAGW